jgi:glyoxylate reductase
VLINGLREADAAICTLTERIDHEVLSSAPRLRVVANYAVGYNNIDLAAARARGVIVTNTPDVLTEATADLTWALLLATARRIPEGHRLVQDGAWSGWKPTQLLGAEVYGKTLGIIGMGRIGQAVARRAAGFNMSVLYSGRKTVHSPGTGESWRRVAFEDLLTSSDFISLHVPLTSETHHLIGAPELHRMRQTAFLINTSRGAVVDEAALVDALREHRLAGAGLDVYEQEPCLHPGLRNLSQVVTLPHLGSATYSARIQMGMVCIENVLAVLEGRPAPNRVA